MKINAGKEIKNMNGVVLMDGPLPFTVGKALANVVISVKQGPVDHLRMFELAKKLYAPECELDASEEDLIRGFIKENKTYDSMILGQVLEELHEAGSRK